jgi:hypothetical protein
MFVKALSYEKQMILSAVEFVPRTIGIRFSIFLSKPVTIVTMHFFTPYSEGIMFRFSPGNLVA